MGHQVRLTREPGGSPLAEKLRALLLDPRQKIEPRTELMLYEAARVEHVEKVIRPALKKKWTVICDRFTDATMAYQGYGRNLNHGMIDVMNRIATENLVPDLTLWLDLPPKQALKKAQARGRGDRLEQEGVAFQKRVRTGYAAAARAHPKRVVRIEVQVDKSSTQALLRRAVQRKFFK